MTEGEWEELIAGIWRRADEMDAKSLRKAIADAVDQQPTNDGVGSFELAGAWDSTGHSDKAIPLYRQALEMGLSEARRRQAVIQLASSLRNTGEFDEALEVLDVEATDLDDGLDDAVVAFRALVLSDLGREREALSVTLFALSSHLPRYQRSVGNYARLLLETKAGERLE